MNVSRIVGMCVVAALAGVSGCASKGLVKSAATLGSNCGHSTVNANAATQWGVLIPSLVQGNLVTIEASGLWSFCPVYGCQSGPDGVRTPNVGEPDDPRKTMDHVLFASLVGRTGDGPMFKIGAHYAAVADRSGPFYYSMNDLNGAFSDNSGALHVTYTVCQ